MWQVMSEIYSHWSLPGLREAYAYTWTSVGFKHVLKAEKVVTFGSEQKQILVWV